MRQYTRAVPPETGASLVTHLQSLWSTLLRKAQQQAGYQSFMAGTFFHISQSLKSRLTVNPMSQNIWTRTQLSQELEVEKTLRITKLSEK